MKILAGFHSRIKLVWIRVWELSTIYQPRHVCVWVRVRLFSISPTHFRSCGVRSLLPLPSLPRTLRSNDVSGCSVGASVVRDVGGESCFAGVWRQPKKWDEKSGAQRGHFEKSIATSCRPKIQKMSPLQIWNLAVILRTCGEAKSNLLFVRQILVDLSNASDSSRFEILFEFSFI